MEQDRHLLLCMIHICSCSLASWGYLLFSWPLCDHICISKPLCPFSQSTKVLGCYLLGSDLVYSLLNPGSFPLPPSPQPVFHFFTLFAPHPSPVTPKALCSPHQQPDLLYGPSQSAVLLWFLPVCRLNSSVLLTGLLPCAQGSSSLVL